MPGNLLRGSDNPVRVNEAFREFASVFGCDFLLPWFQLNFAQLLLARPMLWDEARPMLRAALNA
jgi:hypothetical protein